MADELKGPSVFEIKKFIQEKTPVEFTTLSNQILKGEILWYDGDCFHIKLDNNQELTILKHSIAYYNPQ